MFWRCRCCHSTPAFFAPTIITNAQFPQGTHSYGLFGTDCKLISALQNPPTTYPLLQQQTALTPGNVSAGSTFTVTIGANMLPGPYVITYTTSVGTVADVVQGLINTINTTLSNTV